MNGMESFISKVINRRSSHYQQSGRIHDLPVTTNFKYSFHIIHTLHHATHNPHPNLHSQFTNTTLKRKQPQFIQQTRLHFHSQPMKESRSFYFVHILLPLFMSCTDGIGFGGRWENALLISSREGSSPSLTTPWWIRRPLSCMDWASSSRVMWWRETCFGCTLFSLAWSESSARWRDWHLPLQVETTLFSSLSG